VPIVAIIIIIILCAAALGGLLHWLGKHKPPYFKITASFMRILTLTLEIKWWQDE
jgi:hypothetical protein